MELFSAKQSEYLADYTARDQALSNALRDRYEVVNEHSGFYLTLYIDEDREEGLKKNFYEIIGPTGEKYLYSGCTYRFMGDEEFKLIVQEIQDGIRKPYNRVRGKQS